MGVFLRRPPVPKKADGDEQGVEQTGGEAHLGFIDAVVGFRETHYRWVGSPLYGYEASEKPKSNAEVSQAAELKIPVVDGDEEFSDGSKD